MEPGDFQGTIARYATDGAVAHWPEPARPPDGHRANTPGA